MLADRDLKREFDSIVNVLDKVSSRTDQRFSSDISRIKDAMQQVSAALQEEQNIQSQLNAYRNEGFQVRDFIVRTYTDRGRMLTELKNLMTVLKEMREMLYQFRNLSPKPSKDTQEKFERYIFDPTKLYEARTMWANLRKR